MTPEIERSEWDQRATTMKGARHEASSDLSPSAWTKGAVAHLAMIVPRIADRFGSGLFFDLGCGVGRLTMPMAHLIIGSGTLIGFDISANMLFRFRQRQRLRGPLCSSVLCDGRTIPAIDGVYSAGYSVTMFQHIPPEAIIGYLEEVYRILKPGGIFVFQFVEGSERAPFMYQYDKHAMIGWCLSAGFTITGSRRDPNQYNWRWLTVRK